MRLHTAMAMAICGAALLCACGGGGGGDSSDGSINLSDEPALRMLYDAMDDAQGKSQTETQSEYDARIAAFATGLTGYTSSEPATARYDAESSEMRVSIPIQITEGENELSTPFNQGYTVMSVFSALDYMTTHRNIVGEDGQTRTLSYYTIVPMSTSDAQRLAEGFRADYTYSFSSGDVAGAKYTCISANNTQCRHAFSGTVTSVRLHNVVDKKDYPQGE